MDFVESSLCRLQDSVNRFVVPSAALRDVRTLKAQIEIRGRAVRDILFVADCGRSCVARVSGCATGREIDSGAGRVSPIHSVLGVSFGRA